MFAGLRRLMKGESSVDFIGRSKVWALVSLVVVGVSLGGLIGRGFHLSLEFEGGTAFTVPLERDTTVADVELALERFGLGAPDVQISTSAAGARELRVRTEQIGNRDVLAAVQEQIATLAGQSNPDTVSITDVGPSWGRQISNKALRGLIVFLILVSIYISLRFEWKMAVGALAALFHDLLATAGVYTLLGLEVSPATVVALLTLMGFSLYDTVVVFDKVKENADAMTAGARMSYSQMVNRSINQVLVRSINTSISSVLPVAGLLFVGVFLFGSVTLKDLALAMFIGALVSTYSSIFVAAPILAFLKEREPRFRQLRTRLGTGVRSPMVPAPSAAVDAASDEVAEKPERARTTVRTATPPRAPRGRQRRGGKRRR